MYQFLVWLLHPTMLLLLAALAAAINLFRKRQESKRRLWLVVLPLVLLAMWSMPVVSTLMNGTLEWKYPPVTERPTDAQAIVILGGWMSGTDKAHPKPVLGRDSVFRCLHGAELYRGSDPLPVVVTGRMSEPKEGDPSLARVMADMMQQLGVRESDLIVEEASTNTWENAVESAKLLKERGITRIVLVTDAAHLSRAIGCFEKQGLTVTPAGCRYGRPSVDTSPGAFFPREEAAYDSQVALHEMLGLLWYRVKGRM